MAARPLRSVDRFSSFASGLAEALPMNMTDSIRRSIDGLVLNNRDGPSAYVADPTQTHRLSLGLHAEPRYPGRVGGLPLRLRPLSGGVFDRPEIAHGVNESVD